MAAAAVRAAAVAVPGARLVRAERQGRQVYYGADDAHVRRMVEDMVTHIAEH